MFNASATPLYVCTPYSQMSLMVGRTRWAFSSALLDAGLLEQFTHNDIPRVAISVDMLDTGIDVREME
jgi:hypothetical protein